jgi:hypothetical protein
MELRWGIRELAVVMNVLIGEWAPGKENCECRLSEGKTERKGKENGSNEANPSLAVAHLMPAKNGLLRATRRYDVQITNEDG